MKRWLHFSSFMVMISPILLGQNQYPNSTPIVDANKIIHYTEIKTSDTVFDVINEINLDSLTLSLRILTGEDSVLLNHEKHLYKNRYNENNDDVAAYIQIKLESYGLETHNQPFNTKGLNIYGIQTGSKYPEQYYMVCAHYDAVTDYAADDNATGIATVLEAARILSEYELKYSIIYALWDEEEIGLKGSHYFASKAFSDGLDIKGVLNLDMLGWDSNNDNVLDIHSSSTANSDNLANTILSTNTTYNLGLSPVVYSPGTGASDHASFWAYNYGAVLMIEAYYGNDFNTYYHSTDDRVSTLNLNYYHKMSKLALGSLVSMAGSENSLETNSITSTGRFNLYPNPTNGTITIDNDNTGNYILEITAVSGQLLYSQEMEGIEQQVDLSFLVDGVYYVTIRSEDFVVTKKVVKH